MLVERALMQALRKAGLEGRVKEQGLVEVCRDGVWLDIRVSQTVWRSRQRRLPLVLIEAPALQFCRAFHNRTLTEGKALLSVAREVAEAVAAHPLPPFLSWVRETLGAFGQLKLLSPTEVFVSGDGWHLALTATSDTTYLIDLTVTHEALPSLIVPLLRYLSLRASP